MLILRYLPTTIFAIGSVLMAYKGNNDVAFWFAIAAFLMF